MATSSEDEQDEQVNQLDDTFTPSTVIKDFRKNARRRFTDERKAIQSLVDTEGDLSALTVRRENLKKLFDDCVALQERFVRKTVQDDDDQGREKQSRWSCKLGDDFTETDTLAEGYILAKKSENLPSAPTAKKSLEQEIEAATGRFTAIVSPSHDKQPEGHTRGTGHGVPPEVLHSTALSDPAQEDAVAIAERVRAKRRKLEDDLEESRIVEERKRDDLRRKATREAGREACCYRGKPPTSPPLLLFSSRDQRAPGRRQRITSRRLSDHSWHHPHRPQWYATSGGLMDFRAISRGSLRCSHERSHVVHG